MSSRYHNALLAPTSTRSTITTIAMEWRHGGMEAKALARFAIAKAKAIAKSQRHPLHQDKNRAETICSLLGNDVFRQFTALSTLQHGSNRTILLFIF